MKSITSKVILAALAMSLLVVILLAAATSVYPQTPKSTPTPKPRPKLKQKPQLQVDPADATFFWLKTGLDGAAQGLVEEEFRAIAQPQFGAIIFIRSDEERQNYPDKFVNVLNLTSTLDGVGAEQIDSTGRAITQVVIDGGYQTVRPPGRAGEIADIIFRDGKQNSGVNGNNFRRYYRTVVNLRAGEKGVLTPLTFYWGVKYVSQARGGTTCATIDRFSDDFTKIQHATMDEPVPLGCIVQDATDMGIKRETFLRALQKGGGRWLAQVKTAAEQRQFAAQQQQELAATEAARPKPRQAPVQTNPGCKGDPVCEALGASPVSSQPAPPAPKPTPTPVQPSTPPANAPVENEPQFGHTGRSGFAGFTPTTDVGEGSEGARRALGFFCVGSGDAWFTQQWKPGWAFRVNGPMMTKAITDFQSQNSLAVNGQLDVPTRLVLDGIWKQNRKLFPDMAVLATKPSPCKVK